MKERPHYNKEAKVYTTTIPAHSVARGNMFYNREQGLSVAEATEWQSDPDTHKYTYTSINGVRYAFNEPVEVVVGASTKAR